MFIPPLESAKFVISNSDHVEIDMSSVVNLAQKLQESVSFEEYDLRKWKLDNPLHPQEMNEKTIDWIFLIDSLNFSFWPDKGKEFSINNEIGYWALCAAIKRALEENIPIIDPNYYGKLNLEQARHIFRTDNNVEIPMLEERVAILNENANILIKNFQGKFVNCLRKCNSNAIDLLKLVYEYFPSFRDESIYKGQKVTFLKRAQILIADIWGCFEGKGLGYFNDINQLTMFADYRIPQILHYFNILKYSKELEQKLKQNNLIDNGHPYEIEIRAGSILSIEFLKEEIIKIINNANNGRQPLPSPNSIQLDYYLWGYRRSKSEDIDKKSPFHRVRCIYY